MTTITASQLRQDIFRILDSVIESGRSISILRKGEIIHLAPVKKQSKIAKLKKHDFSDEPLEAFDHIDWSTEWTGGQA